jgi:hypothetical protein
VAKLKEVVVDSAHPAALARFWAEALDGYSIRPYDAEEIARLGRLGLTPETDPSVMVDEPGPSLCFQLTFEPKTTRNRMHLDIAASRGPEVARLTELGARVRDQHDGFTVMLDPEGNEFCVVDARVR